MAVHPPPETFDEIRDEQAGEAFPCDQIRGLETALALFAAGFYGKQDAFWIAEAGIKATCIDTDADRLDAMAAVYPTNWDFLERDAYVWANSVEGVWDLVTVDCPSGHFERCADLLWLWCSLALHLVILGCGKDYREQVTAPQGWKVGEIRKRSDYDGGVFWAVLERA